MRRLRRDDGLLVIDPRALINVVPFAWDGDEPTPGVELCEIHESAYVGPLAVVQYGNVRRTTIGAKTRIDACCHIGHDSVIGEGVTITAHAVLCGHVTVEEQAYIGVGALIRQRLRIGRGALVGMGAVVTKDVPPNCVVAGNPARFLKLRWPDGTDCRLWTWDGTKWRRP